jgi:hypothetical protein
MIRIFNVDFSTCISELKINGPVIDTSLNIYQDTLALITSTGCISVYDIENQHHATVMRSHTENCNSIAYMKRFDTIVTAASQE